MKTGKGGRRLNEISLIKKSQKGDKKAFEELIRCYYPYVSGFLLKITANETLTEDLTQDTFLKMVRNIEKFKPDSKASFGTWIITIAKNCFLDYMRHEKIHTEDIEDFEIPDKNDVASTVEKKLQYEEVLTAVDRLPKEQGLLIRLKYEESLTLAEISEKLNIPQKTVKSRIHEGTVKLRKWLSPNERKNCL